MDRHEPDGVNALRCGRQLPKVALVAEPYKAPYAIKQARYGQPTTARLGAHEVQELPKCDAASAVDDIDGSPNDALRSSFCLAAMSREPSKGPNSVQSRLGRRRGVASSAAPLAESAGNVDRSCSAKNWLAIMASQVVQYHSDVVEAHREIGTARDTS